MEPWRTAHLFLLAAWAGLVLGETVLEFSIRDAAEARAVARVHALTDVIVEIPLLLGILVTGGALLYQLWPATTLHWVKIACALAALAANGWCAAVVFQRKARIDQPSELMRLSHRLRASWVGVPFAVAALVIGLGYFHR